MPQSSPNLEQRGFEYGVQHILSPRTAPLEDILGEMLNLSTADTDFLLDIGAIYIQGSRISESLTLASGTYVRVHTKPRRFPVNSVDWASRIVFSHKDFLVLNKPAEIPCHASVDNIRENVLNSLTELFGREFFITHRLDVPTSGLLVVARTKDFQKSFNEILQKKSVRKIYRAICTEKAPSLGRLRHYMIDSPRAPKILSLDPEAGLLCELDVLSVTASGNLFAVDIELLTGRTHQIRAQMSFEGAPLENDFMYGAEKISAEDKIGLCAREISFAHPATGENFHFQL